MQVLKRDGRCEDFQQQKLTKGLELACLHTTIRREQAIALASQITLELLQRQVREITTKELGEIVMQRLQALDPIAYIRFACVYRRFRSIDELIDAIKALQAK